MREGALSSGGGAIKRQTDRVVYRVWESRLLEGLL